MIDTKDPCKRPWVWTFLLGVINEDIPLVEGNVNDVLILLSVICREVDLHDRMLVEGAVSNDEVIVATVVVGWVGLVQACVEVLFEVREEVLRRYVSTSRVFQTRKTVPVPSKQGRLHV